MNRSFLRRAPLSRLFLLALLLGGVACSRGGQTRVARLIDADRDATVRLDPLSDFDLQTAWRASIEGPASLAAWSFYVPNAPATLASRGGIDLEPLHRSRYLVWSGSLDAAAFDYLRFRFRAPLAGQVELYWNGAGEDFAPQRYLLASPDPRDSTQVAFDVGSSHTWRGTIARFGLLLLQLPAAGQALAQAEGLRFVAAPGLGQGETRYVDLDDRGMAAWLARPTLSLHRRLTVPRGAQLRLQAAPWLPAGKSVRIRILARGRQGEQVLVDRELRPAAEPPRRRWSGLQADLRPLAGETVDLVFETGPAPPGALVLWGNPRIVSTAGTPRLNVILVSLDTVRADHLSLYGYRRLTTPQLAAWARRWATVFETTVASAPWTLPSHVSMLSGVDAVHHGVNRHGPVPASLTLLPERFRDAGYATYATTAGLVLSPEEGFARGFDELDVRGKTGSQLESEVELSAGIEDALHWLESHRRQRFFLFFHTYEAHTPYQAREPYFSRFGGDPKALNAGQPVWLEESGFEDRVRPLYGLFHPPYYAEGVTYPKRVLRPRDRDLAATLYDSGLAYIDSQLDRLFQYLEAHDLLDDTIVVVTSDHGEALFEHGLTGHSSLYDHDLLVPLVIAAPLDGARGRRVAAQVRSVDIAPTLLALAGLPSLPGIDGRSLVPFLRGVPAPPRDAWSYALSTVRGVSLRSAARHTKVIGQDTIFDPFRGGLETYDLRRDPGELRNLATPAGEPLRKRLVQEVRADAAALRIEVSNTGPGELTGLLAGSWIDEMITSPDLTFSCCASDPEGIPFHAPPGAHFTLLLQDRRSAGALRLRLTTAGRTWNGTLTVNEGRAPQRIVWDKGRWRQVTAQADAVSQGPWTGIEIRLRGSLPGAQENDEQVRARLRALGYIR